MTAHLHLHLEPGERKRRQQGRELRAYHSARQFFAAHDLAAPGRPEVTLDDLAGFIAELHSEQRGQGVTYAELRLSPRRLTAAGVLLASVLHRASEACTGLAGVPVIRLILLLNRDSPASFAEECEEAVRRGLPPAFAGIDLAGDEVRYPDVRPFERCFRAARDAGLGVTVHAGEFGGPSSIWAALDRLGAQRIGHGVAAGRSRALAARLRRDNVAIEVSLTSNVALGAVSSAGAHPLPWLIRGEVPVCLNTDVPLHIGSSLQDEWRLAGELIGPAILKRLQDQAVSYRFAAAGNEPANRSEPSGVTARSF